MGKMDRTSLISKLIATQDRRAPKKSEKMSLRKSRDSLKKTLAMLKQSAKKLSGDASPERPSSVNDLDTSLSNEMKKYIEDSKKDEPFRRRKNAADKLQALRKRDKANKNNPRTSKRKYVEQPRTVEISDKISIEELMRKYKYDFDSFCGANNTKGSYLKNVAKKILEDQAKLGLDENHKRALEEFCKPWSYYEDRTKCPLCDKGPYSKKKLELHNSFVHDQFERNCCGKKYTSKGKYLYHAKSHSPSASRASDYECQHCGKMFLNTRVLSRHVETIHNKPNESCTICKRQFSDRGNLRRHIRQVHTDLKPYKCDECGQTFGDKGNLNRHVLTRHEGAREQCPQCSQTCILGTLQRHIRSVHLKQIYNCSDCDKDFRTRYGLHSHVNEKHKSVPTEYACEICGEKNLFSPQARGRHKRQNHKDILENRVRSHKIPQYECSFCAEKFARRVDRDIHQEKIHNALRDFVCGDCGKRAQTEKRLKLHKEKYCQKTSEYFEEDKNFKVELLKSEERNLK